MDMVEPVDLLDFFDMPSQSFSDAEPFALPAQLGPARSIAGGGFGGSGPRLRSAGSSHPIRPSSHPAHSSLRSGSRDSAIIHVSLPSSRVSNLDSHILLFINTTIA